MSLLNDYLCVHWPHIYAKHRYAEHRYAERKYAMRIYAAKRHKRAAGKRRGNGGDRWCHRYCSHVCCCCCLHVVCTMYMNVLHFFEATIITCNVIVYVL